MVDTKCTSSKVKYRKQSSAFNSDNVNDDEDLLRQPMRASSAGFKEAKKVYENGTEEVRLLLMQECSLIYECNVCRNLFRSLANFISHKRNYCKSITQYNPLSYPDCGSSVLKQTVKHSERLLIKSRSTDSSPIPNTKPSNRDLSKVIERLKRVEVSSSCTNDKPMTVGYNAKASLAEIKTSDSVPELERIPTTTNTVHQTLIMKYDVGNIKTEVDEAQNLSTNHEILLRPNVKAGSLNSTAANVSENKYETTQLLPGFSCEVCNISFQTEKTLKMHVQKTHTSSTYVFQCPACAMTFFQPAAVIRHLANEHKKPLRRIRKMRDTILKKRIQIGDVQVKRLDREMKRLQMTTTKDLDSPDMVKQQNVTSITSCMYCFKNFERRAALATHLTNCFARKTSFAEANQNEQSTEPKTHNQITKQFLGGGYLNRNDEIMNGERKLDKINIKQEPKEDLNATTDSSNINKMFEDLENQTFGNGLQTVCLEKIQILKEMEEKNETTKNEENEVFDCCHDQNNKRNRKEINATNRYKPIQKDKSKRFRLVSASKQLTCRCKICNKQFNALSNLRRHISMFHYRSRRFGCKLCDYRAFRRYDIVNHLTYIHKMTGERESMAVEYVTVHELKYSKDDVDGDIVVVNDEQNNNGEEHPIAKESQSSKPTCILQTNGEEDRREKVCLESDKVMSQPFKMDLITSKDKSYGKTVRRKFKTNLEQEAEGKKRPIRNRIKTVNKDFVYDALTIREEPKRPPRLTLKRRDTLCVDKNNVRNDEFTPPPIKITPYRLRTEPLMPSDKCIVRGVASNVCRNVIHEGMAAPSTLPDLPTERPQMRPRLISSSRGDANTVPVIETSELEAAGLKSTFFDDSFLEKFAKKSNPSFKMKPLLALQHSPLNSILQKFDASQQSNSTTAENKIFQKLSKEDNDPAHDYTICLLQRISQPIFKETDLTPNGKQGSNPPSPPAAPKKRITLMQRLAENRARAKRTDSLICTTLEN